MERGEERRNEEGKEEGKEGPEEGGCAVLCYQTHYLLLATSISEKLKCMSAIVCVSPDTLLTKAVC